MTQPGELDRRLTLEAPVETDDGAGGVTRTYETVTDRPPSSGPVVMLV